MTPRWAALLSAFTLACGDAAAADPATSPHTPVRTGPSAVIFVDCQKARQAELQAEGARRAAHQRVGEADAALARGLQSGDQQAVAAAKNGLASAQAAQAAANAQLAAIQAELRAGKCPGFSG